MSTKANNRKNTFKSDVPFLIPRELSLLFLSAAGLVLTFPPFDLEPLAWVVLVPFFLVIWRKDGFRAFSYGFIWGLLFFSGILYWIVYAVKVYGRLPLYSSITITLLLILYLSIYPAVFALSFSYIRRLKGIYPILFLSSLWVTLEYIRGHLFTGFPWELLGYSQYRFLYIIQIADITGVYGVSFLLVAFNSFILLLWIEKRLLLKETIVVVCLLILTLSYGHLKMDNIRTGVESRDSIKVGVVQGNIEQDKKWNPMYQSETVRIYKRETLKVLDKNLDLVVWPETATPFYLQSDDTYTPVVLDFVKDNSTWLLTGSPAYEYGEKGVRYLNSAFLLSSRGFEGRYDKLHLVPFGEYVPLKRFLPFIHKLVEGIGDFSPGKGVVLLDLPWGSFGVVICYEAIFPELFRQFVKEGADFMVNITNDAWYGRTSAPFQHLSHTVFRSVENRVFLVRAANTGISGIVAPDGRIVQRTPIFEKASFSENIGLKNTGSPFYTLYGDVFAWFCLVVSIIFLFHRVRYRSKRNLGTDPHIFIKLKG